jgi:sigma-B regulation protein RsbU (phosphoserine phosphatase)
MIYGVLSPDGRLTYSNGGHNPPFLLRKRAVRRLEAGGVILGLFGDAGYEEESLHLEPGDLIVVFSDGVSEAVNSAGDEFGDDRIVAALSSRKASRTPRASLDALLDDVRSFSSGTAQRDDLTALIVKYQGVE